MSFFKFNLFAFLLFLLSISQVHADECIGAHYETQVAHKGQPFGLSQTILSIEKSGCEIVVKHERFKFLKKEWLIDVCRGPVHIKAGARGVKVLRREGVCTPDSANPFCVEKALIEKTIEDDGLIFAQGDKDVLADDHGKVFCAARLIDLYLGQGQVLSSRGPIASPETQIFAPVEILEVEVETEEEGHREEISQ